MTRSEAVRNSKTISLLDSHIVQIIGGSMLIALCAQVSIPLWFTPVPLTLQTFAAMFLGAIFGRRNGSLSVIFYLAQVSAGLPFCSGGIADPLRLIGPTGGYLIAMVAQAYLIGWIFEQRKALSYGMVLGATLLVSMAQLAIGALWLSAFVGFSHMLTMGFTPFVPGELIKSFAVTSLCLVRRGR